LTLTVAPNTVTVTVVIESLITVLVHGVQSHTGVSRLLNTQSSLLH